MELKDTVELMNSVNYRERFIAEYKQTKIRYEKLKAFNTRIEVAEMAKHCTELYPEDYSVDHSCPLELLQRQQHIMGEYLHILELRAVIEKISLL